MRNGENINITDEILNDQYGDGLIFEGEKSTECDGISPEKIITLQGEKELKIELQKKIQYLNGDNFRLQIGKMQENVDTIYSDDVLRCFISYMLKHVEIDKVGNGKIIVQLWPVLAQKLLQGETDKILDYDDEKKKIQELIDRFGEKGKIIEIQNVADNYPDVFGALKKGKDGIIPEKEPDFKNIGSSLESPLEIINYLAYHAKKDKKLMSLFYKTKPDAYINQDKENGIMPGDNDSDYYSIVEVGIRLYEILKGIYIQGGIDRQKVYDKIIGLIIFGEDKISTRGKELNIKDYPSLQKLHKWIKKCCGDIRMEQLYLDLSKLNDTIKREKLKKQKEKELLELKSIEDENSKLRQQISINDDKISNLQQSVKEKEKELSKLDEAKEKFRSVSRKTSIGLAMAMLLGGMIYSTHKAEKSQKRLDNFIEWHKDKEDINIHNELIKGLRCFLNLNENKGGNNDKIEELFKAFIKTNKGVLEDWSNGIVSTESIIADFWDVYGGILITQYGVSQEMVNLEKEYNDIIENTINHETIESKKFPAIIDGKIYQITGHFNGGDQIYCLKKVIVDDGGSKKQLLFASRGFGGPYTLYNGFLVASGIDKFIGAQRYAPELFDSSVIDDTKQWIINGNFSLDINVGKSREYTMICGASNCYIYSLYDACTMPYASISQCDEDKIIIYGDFSLRGAKGFFGETYNLIRVPICGKEYLVASYLGRCPFSTEMLKYVDRDCLTNEEIIALENTLHSGFSISGAYFNLSNNDNLLNFQIYKPNYSFSPTCAIDGYDTEKISIDGEDFYIHIFDCGYEEGKLLFAAKGSNRGSFTLENGKIVAEYLKKYKDVNQ